MKKNFLLFFAFIFFLGTNLILIKAFAASLSVQARMKRIFSEIDNTSTTSQKEGFSAAPLVLGAPASKDMNLVDSRVARLKAFFRQHNSPLYDLAEHIVQVSDKYEFDYRLLPSIAMTESNACNKIPENSYNCFGWGINSTQTIHFTSFEEGIDTVAAGLKKNYIDRGLVTPEAIMAKYAPSSYTWAGQINHFLGILE